jgi:hypothetical protein
MQQNSDSPIRIKNDRLNAKKQQKEEEEQNGHKQS